MSVSVSRDASSLWAQRLLQKHQAYSAQIEASSEATDLEPVVAACNEQIAIAPEVAQVLQHQLPDPLPSHPGYDRLSHIHASQGRWAEAVCLCCEAQAQGWKGPWAERIAQLTAAQQSPITRNPLTDC